VPVAEAAPAEAARAEVARVEVAVGGLARSEPGLGGQEERIVDAALACIGRWGTTKTTLDDVARQARCSRATVYRLFPGGKDAVLDAVARTELARFFDALSRRLALAETPEDVFVAGMTEAGRRVRDHQGLQFLLAYEPGVILPRLAFGRADEVLRHASAFAAPYLERWMSPDDARRAAEFATRLTLSYSICPSGEVDLTDEESVRGLVRTFVLPSLYPSPDDPERGARP
jgi:AcrR family transcriptional regulator